MFTAQPIDRTMTQILLSLWSESTRRVESLPKVRVYSPQELVRIVATASAVREGDYL